MPRNDAIDQLLERQSGVIARRQVEECGEHLWDINRRLRRREWVRLLPGVYVDHTGTPTWLQRAWAGVLYLWPAALSGESAIRAVVGPGWRHHDPGGPIELAVDGDRNVAAPPGYRRRRLARFDEAVQWNASPPRVRIEDAVLDVASALDDDFAVIGRLADACQSRMTTATRLREACARRRRMHRRAWISQVLDDVAEGTCSVLEHAYATRVERAHGLPTPRRQAVVVADGRTRIRDVDHDDFDLVVELDGRMFHDSSGQRDVDLDRDLDAALDGRLTVRLGWGQVLARPCRTAGKVAALLQHRGWTGAARPCGPSCALPGTDR